MRSLMVGAVIGVAMLAGSAHATVILASSQAELGAGADVAWGQLGPAGAHLFTPQSALSDGGLAVRVSTPPGEVFRRDQGVDWSGGFAAGTQLLFEEHENEPLQLSFEGAGVTGIGAAIEESVPRGFVATLTVFGLDGGLLGSLSAPGGDGPVFLGALSDVPIGRVRFSTVGPGGLVDAGFALGPLALRVLPEPSSIALLIAGLGGLVVLRRRRGS